MRLHGHECIYEPEINREFNYDIAPCDPDLRRNDCYYFGPYFDIFSG